MYKNFFKYSEEIYLVNLEEGYCRFKGCRKRMYASPAVLLELKRSQWREEKNGKRLLEHTFSYDNEDDDGIPFYEYLLNTSSPNPEQLLEKKYMHEVFETAFKTLTEKERTVAFLYYFEGLKEHEVGERMGCSTARVHYYKKRMLYKLSQNEELREIYQENFRK